MLIHTPIGHRYALTVLLAVLTSPAWARLVEEQLNVPVQVVDAYGKRIDHTLVVTVFSDDANPRPAPVLVLNHGRSPEPEGRAKLGRARYSEASRFFVRRGFIVAVPTRIGYGVTGGEDVEDTGPCQRKNYPPGYAVATEQTLTALQAVRQRPDAAPDRAIVAGQSYGGTTAVAVAARNPAGVQATINFAGGGGGNPKTQPGRPCAPQQLERLFADYGKLARMPVLWLYAQNDLYFGPTHPKEWFEAFQAAGGAGEFTLFAPQGEDGHSTFTRFPATWQPRVAEFLDRLGFAAPQRVAGPATSSVNKEPLAHDD